MSSSSPLSVLFARVVAINNLVGNTAHPNRETALHQLKGIIRPEMEELQIGIDMRDLHETRDGLADVLFTLAGLYGRMGLAIPEHWDLTDLSGLRSTNDCLRKLFDCQTALEIIAEQQFAGISAAMSAIAGNCVELAIKIAQLEDIDYLSDLEAVIASNMTKFDRDEESAKATRDKYWAISVDTFQKNQSVSEDEPPYIVTFSAKDQHGYDGKDYPMGKWLKSVNFQDTDFR